MTSEDIRDNILNHLDTQISSITGVQTFLNIDPTTYAVTEKMDWLGFAYVVSRQRGKYVLCLDHLPDLILNIRLGIGIGDTKKDEHRNQLELACDRLGDWFDTWYANSTWQSIVGVTSIGTLKEIRNTAKISSQPLRSMAYIDVPMLADRRTP